MNRLFVKFSLIAVSLFAYGCSSLKLCSSKAESEIISFGDTPEVGTLPDGEIVRLGGFSALKFVKKEKNLLYFKTVTDRGPNGNEIELDNIKARIFPLPNFNPSVVEFVFNMETKRVTILNRQELEDSNGKAFNGLPPDLDTDLKGKINMEAAADMNLKLLTNERMGVDSEGYCESGDKIYVSDEYGPYLLRFDSQLQFEKSWRPGKGLSESFFKRKINRGFEGLACNESMAYLMLQSPLVNAGVIEDKNIRLVEFNLAAEKVEHEYYYPIEPEKADKVSDLTIVGDRTFLAIEQNGKPGKEKGIRNLFWFDLKKADTNGFLTKKLFLNLNDVGFENFEKIEGIAVVDDHTLALVTDNDFGLAGGFNKETKKLEFKKDRNSYFILIHLKDAF